MKIICSDNFDRDYMSDQLVAENVPKNYAKVIVEFLNDKHSSGTSPCYYRMVKDDYKLYTVEL